MGSARTACTGGGSLRTWSAFARALVYCPGTLYDAAMPESTLIVSLRMPSHSSALLWCGGDSSRHADASYYTRVREDLCATVVCARECVRRSRTWRRSQQQRHRPSSPACSRRRRAPHAWPPRPQARARPRAGTRSCRRPSRRAAAGERAARARTRGPAIAAVLRTRLRGASGPVVVQAAGVVTAAAAADPPLALSLGWEKISSGAINI